MAQSGPNSSPSDQTAPYVPEATKPVDPELTEASVTASSGALSQTEVAGLIRADQRKRWKDGDQVSAETYINNFPSLKGNEPALLDLVYNEVLLREENGEKPEVDEYIQRFPHLEAQLRRQFALHAMLESKRSASGKSATTLDRSPADSTVGTKKPTITGYEIVGELGRGGMGVVYKARQTKLNRVVALKMVLSGQHAGKDDLYRFRTEAEAVACLQHENIVQIYEVGEQDGRPYFSLEYVPGGTLDDKLEREAPLPPANAARLMETLARAVHVAHQHGIIHRDLKPGNVLLTSDGAPKITDFGLAKRLDTPGQTSTGSVMGTPSYMAPEQAEGRTRDIGTPTDVWALGAILYETLTGRPPFLADAPLDTMLLVVRADPVPPARLNHKVPRDLDTICLKCLEKDPRRRYPSALALAEDLQRFLNNEPIVARPIAVWERSLKWAKRRPAAAGILLVSLLALVALIGIGIWYQGHLAAALAESRRLQKDAEDARSETNRQMLRLRVISGNQLVDMGDLLGSLPWFARALELEQSHAERAAMHRIRLGTVLRQCPTFSQLWFHNGRVLWASFSPDGRRAVTASSDDTARVWDVASGEPVGEPMQHAEDVVSAAFSPDGKLVATASDDHTARVWDAQTGKHVTPPLKHGGMVFCARFSPDGKRVLTASADKTACIWNAATGKQELQFKHGEAVRDANWNHDGSRIVTASADRSARIWDAVTGQPVGAALQHDKDVIGAVFNGHGDKVATASADYTARVWNAATGKALGDPLSHKGPVNFVVFSPDPEGRQLATGSDDNRVRLWDDRGGSYGLMATLRHGSNVYDASFSPDGKLLASASDDNTARIWETATGEAHGAPLKHVATVYRATFAPDGKHVLTACADSSARIWLPNGTKNLERTLALAAPVTGVHFHPSGTELLTADAGGIAAVWDAGTGKRLEPVMKHDGLIHRAIYSPDGGRIATCSEDSTARVWDARSRKAIGRPLQHRGDVTAAAFSPDSRRVVTASADRTACVWDADSGAELLRFTGHHRSVRWAAFSPDGRAVATASADKTAQVWDAATGALLFEPLRHREEVERVAYSPDGRLLVTASDDGTAQVWDARTGKPVGQPLRHSSKVYKAQFSPDSQRVVTASDDDTARVWDAATGQPLTPPLRHGGTVSRAQFSPDGRLVLTASEDNTARLWDAATGEPVTPPFEHQLPVTDAYFSPDGAHIATACADEKARIWQLLPDPRPVEDLVLVAKLLAGGWIDSTGGFVPLQPDALKHAWQQGRRLFHD
jgi:WD40 repeat protein/serine/threonine protein kinase